VRRYHDRRGRRLVYAGAPPDAAFWDAQWSREAADLARTLARARTRASFVTRATARYVAPGDGSILEAGCGWGQFLVALRARGYRAIGMDFARATLAALAAHERALPLVGGDVRRLPFADGAFAGVWSLGVIEHFPAGKARATVIAEMARVLRPGGVLFLTCPRFSPLRKARALLGGYPPLVGDLPADFYQDALDPRRLARDVARHGFTLVERGSLDGLKGLKDELPPLLARPLQVVYRHPSLAARLVRAALGVALAPPCGHAALLVFRRARAVRRA